MSREEVVELADETVIPYHSVDDALDELTQVLQTLVPYRAWLVTRVEGREQLILHARDTLGRYRAGQVLSWEDGFCIRMAEQGAPRFAQAAQLVEAYRNAPVNADVRVGAYIGQPLKTTDGVFLGVLCAIDPNPQDELPPEHQLIVETISKTMALLLQGRVAIEKARQREAWLKYRSETDELTGLANRRGWDLAIQEEDAALGGLGSNAMVLVIDLDGLKRLNDTAGHAAGDELIKRSAMVLQQQLRDVDVIARLGGDEFAVLARGFSEEVAAKVVTRLRAAFDEAGVGASLGYAMRRTHGRLESALHAADQQMYLDKSSRKSQGLNPPR